ncbi:hypothetical protein SmJEL517_g04610 [Synchytrium microbalum]|uniref:Uncharacterized protein n=1 Tax=Synchytrium microbalum TaxID=1806994 RepID=A0A507C3T4_9FUNG|nr:uncharacterized protein SmJEL517_g04610 [Synchytrium microbalum]TPX32183.1 hypothetical protein SmJEL517_g04610 [Synchytrium microbalum]
MEPLQCTIDDSVPIPSNLSSELKDFILEHTYPSSTVVAASAPSVAPVAPTSSPPPASPLASTPPTSSPASSPPYSPAPVISSRHLQYIPAPSISSRSSTTSTSSLNSDDSSVVRESGDITLISCPTLPKLEQKTRSWFAFMVLIGRNKQLLKEADAHQCIRGIRIEQNKRAEKKLVGPSPVEKKDKLSLVPSEQVV